jgi:thiamine-monophosphate kinase
VSFLSLRPNAISCPRLMAMGFSESDVISVLQKIFTTQDPRIHLGIGDDAAVVATSPRSVVSSDMAVEGVHFKTEWSSAFDIGRKITAANVADILAMGGRCDYLVAAVSLTGTEELSWIENLARGMHHEATLAGAVIVGGDIARASQIVIAMTAVGTALQPITRRGAQVGDSIYLSSLPGWSAAGLELLTREISVNSLAADMALSQFSAPSLDYAINFSGASAMVDLSDSLMVQGGQIASASGVALELKRDLFAQSDEFAELSNLATEINADVWQWIFGGGEDHVLLATGKNLPGLHIGEVVAGSGITGLEMEIAPVSWSHFQP